MINISGQFAFAGTDLRQQPHGIGRLAPVAVALTLLASACGASEPRVTVEVDAYAAVNWATFEQHKANLHTHTTQSDGRLTPHQVIDAYHQLGYTLLAITDHNLSSWPWTGLAELPRRGRAAQADRAAARSPGEPPSVPPYQNRDPEALGMLAVAGNEFSRHHHLGGFFIDFQSDSEDVDETLTEIEAEGGLAILYHPGRYWEPDEDGAIPPDVLSRYLDWFRRHDHLVGFEIFNQANRYPHDLGFWDAVLSVTMPKRSVWGFANDDMHTSSHIGRDWNTFVLRRLDEAHVRAALQRGQFYFSTVSTHDRDLRDRAQTPVITSISHNRRAGTITLKATSGGDPLPEDRYRWISEGHLIHTGPILDYRTTPEVGGYVRAELIGRGGTTFTNPVGLKRR